MELIPTRESMVVIESKEITLNIQISDEPTSMTTIITDQMGTGTQAPLIITLCNNSCD